MIKWEHNGFWITDDPASVRIEFVTAALQTTYWAKERSQETIQRSLQNSVVLSVFTEHEQIGLARIIGDWATFAWICDVYIDPQYRGQGLGKWLMQCVLKHPICEVKLRLLATKDAQGLYQQFGFTNKECMVCYQTMHSSGGK